MLLDKWMQEHPDASIVIYWIPNVWTALLIYKDEEIAIGQHKTSLNIAVGNLTARCLHLKPHEVPE